MGNNYYLKHKGDRHIVLSLKEKLAIQTILAMEIRSNEECSKQGITPCFKTTDLKEMYKKVAGYEYDESVLD